MTGKWGCEVEPGTVCQGRQYLEASEESEILKVRRKSIPSAGHSKSQGPATDQHRTLAAQGKADTAGFH